MKRFIYISLFLIIAPVIIVFINNRLNLNRKSIKYVKNSLIYIEDIYLTPIMQSDQKQKNYYEFDPRFAYVYSFSKDKYDEAEKQLNELINILSNKNKEEITRFIQKYKDTLMRFTANYNSGNKQFYINNDHDFSTANREDTSTLRKIKTDLDAAINNTNCIYDTDNKDLLFIRNEFLKCRFINAYTNYLQNKFSWYQWCGFSYFPSLELSSSKPCVKNKDALKIIISLGYHLASERADIRLDSSEFIIVVDSVNYDYKNDFFYSKYKKFKLTFPSNYCNTLPFKDSISIIYHNNGKEIKIPVNI